MVDEKSLPQPGKCLPQNVTSLPMRAKILISPKAAEKFVPPAYRMLGSDGGERTLSTLSLSYKAVYRKIVLVLVD